MPSYVLLAAMIAAAAGYAAGRVRLGEPHGVALRVAGISAGIAAGLGLWALASAPERLDIAGAALAGLVAALFAIDARARLLPNMITGPMAAAGLIAAWTSGAPFSAHLIGMVAGFMALALADLGYEALRGRPGLGMGDAKMLGAVGAWLGWTALADVVFLAAFMGVIWGVGLVALRKSKGSIPFGPFLALGGWTIWLYGSILN